MPPIILHLDMNSYFASVEQQDNPEYRGKPVGVCEHLGGIIIAASIEAKRWGIKTGTAVWEARKLYPKIILTKTHPERYRLYASRLHRVVGDYTDKVEVYSIDEVFLDITKASNIRIPITTFQKPNSYQMSGAIPSCDGMALTNDRVKFPISNFSAESPDRHSGGPPTLALRPLGGQDPEVEYYWMKHQQDYRAADPFEEAVKIAQTIKRRMKREVGDYLTCSVGIGPNKLIAKIASDLQKPDGLVVVKSAECGVKSAGVRAIVLTKEDLYHRLKLIDIPGIGVRQERRLNEMGIKTLADLRKYPKSWLVSKFGILGHHLHSMGQLEGSWKEDVADEQDIKSMGHMYTLPEEYRERKYFVPVLYRLCEMVSRRLRLQGLWGNVLHFHLHDKDHECYGQSKKLGYNTQDGREIFLECMKIFDRINMEGYVAVKSATDQRSRQRPISGIKLIGVTVSGLSEAVNQLSLFGDAERTRRVDEALDKLDKKYGDFTVCRAPVIAARNVIRDSIGFGRLRERNEWKEMGDS